MINPGLVRDYLERSQHRLAAIEVLYERQSWADVVLESQEVVELTLKALLRHANIDPPRIHDVGKILMEHQHALPVPLRGHAARMAEISKQLRRDRELAFCGSEDLTPGEFYEQSDASRARQEASWLVQTICDVLLVVS